MMMPTALIFSPFNKFNVYHCLYYGKCAFVPTCFDSLFLCYMMNFSHYNRYLKNSWFYASVFHARQICLFLVTSCI